MELPPERSRLFEYLDVRGCGMALTQTFQTHWAYGCQGWGDTALSPNFSVILWALKTWIFRLSSVQLVNQKLQDKEDRKYAGPDIVPRLSQSQLKPALDFLVCKKNKTLSVQTTADVFVHCNQAISSEYRKNSASSDVIPSSV